MTSTYWLDGFYWISVKKSDKIEDMMAPTEVIIRITFWDGMIHMRKELANRSCFFCEDLHRLVQGKIDEGDTQKMPKHPIMISQQTMYHDDPC